MKTAVNTYRNEKLITFAESKMIPGDHYNGGIQTSNQEKRWLILFSRENKSRPRRNIKYYGRGKREDLILQLAR